MRGVDPKIQDDRASGLGYLVGVVALLVAGIGRVIFG